MDSFLSARAARRNEQGKGKNVPLDGRCCCSAHPGVCLTLPRVKNSYWPAVLYTEFFLNARAARRTEQFEGTCAPLDSQRYCL